MTAAGLPKLRDYQVKAVNEARSLYGAGHSKVLLTAPTGAGKTTVFSYIVASAQARGRTCVVIAHRTELIEQASARLDLYGIDHGVIQAKHHRTNPYLPVQVASIDTLRNRPYWWGRFDFIVIDEAHRSLAPTYHQFVDAHQKGKILGVTATPYRTDGKGLGEIYTAMVRGPSVGELIDLGFLVPPRMFAPSAPDLSGLKISRGDYDQDALADRVDQADLIGDMVKHWKLYARDRRTVAFAVNVQHSMHIVELFQNAGVRAAHLDGETPADQRAEILRGIATGDLELVSNVGVLTEGTDIPSIGAIIMARPTQSKGLYIQACGRGLRPDAGKRDCIILDHAGCCLMHGALTDPVEVTLEEGIVKKRRKLKPDEAAEQLRQCGGCYAIYSASSRTCPECGRSNVSVREIEQRDGELVEVDMEKLRRERQEQQAKAASLEQLELIERQRGYRRGWAQHVWKARHKKGAGHDRRTG